MTERVIIASKGRFDRARTAKKREEQHLPHESSITADEFMEATLDVWEIAPESARRVNHPAPFPVELPQRLIELYTYRSDLILDPFMGSGSTLVAAVRTDRRYAGYDMDPTYVELASRRVKDEKASQAKLHVVRVNDSRPPPPRVEPGLEPGLERKTAHAIAEGVVEDAGFTILHRNQRQRGCGVGVSIVAADAEGVRWYFDVTGAFTTTRSGLARTDTLFRSLGRASVLRSTGKWPVVLLTSSLPRRKSEGDQALRAAGPRAVFDAIELRSDDGRRRLRTYGEGGQVSHPSPGFWTELELTVL